MRRDILGFLTSTHERYGDLVEIDLGMPPARLVVYLLTRPSLVEIALESSGRHTRKSLTRRPARALFGTGLLTAEGEEWEQGHELLAPFFRQVEPGVIRDIAFEECEILAHRLRGQGGNRRHRVVIDDLMARITLSTITRAMLGERLEPRQLEAIAESFSIITKEIWRQTMSPLYWLTTLLSFGPPLRRSKLFDKALGQLEDIVSTLLEPRRRGYSAPRSGRADLISRLLEFGASRQNSGAYTIERLLRDHLITLLVAGHETTAVALTWTWNLLAAEPIYFDALKELSAAGDDESMKYATWLFSESLRLYPPAWSITRDLVEDISADGVNLTAPAIVIASPYVSQRSARYWDTPLTFLPQRWESPHNLRGVYYPFGLGPRRCIGAGIAMSEGPAVLAAFARFADIEFARNVLPEPIPALTMRPSSKLEADLILR